VSLGLANGQATGFNNELSSLCFGNL
jgi:hypothetical protein